MKKLLLLIVAVVAVGGLGLAVVNHYQSTKTKTQAQAVPMVSVADANKRVESVKSAADAEYQTLVVSFNQSVAECQKGVAAYAKLTTTQKQGTVAPTCAAPLSTQ